ncbi:tRNA-dihydrouridine synthase 2 [Elasticomyces elasticus]|nr:tRNA-dihydrouridine synthase 2 [Elasticomyces elasticus]
MTHPRVPIPKRGVDYRGKIALAPMVRSGECPSRLLALKYGADLVWGPETIDKALIGCTRRLNPITNTVDFTRYSNNGVKHGGATEGQRESVIYRLHPEIEGEKLIYQIGTSDPETAVQAASMIAPDVAGIDVNAGCPKPFSTTGGMGAALLKTPDKLCAILEALVKEVGNKHEIGISVKIRILDTLEDTEKLVRRLVATGITGLTVHCRTTPMRPRERAIRDQLRMIVDLCHEAGIACLMNGDVTSRDEALQLMQEYGTDGAMIATAAEKNSSCFRSEKDGGLAPWQEIAKEYLRFAMEVENRWGNTKFLLAQIIPGRAPAHQAMAKSRGYFEVAQALELGDELIALAKSVDERLEIGVVKKETKAERKAKNKVAQQTAQEKRELKAAAKTMPRTSRSRSPAAKKRKVDIGELDMPLDVSREMGPGTVTGQASTLAV